MGFDQTENRRREPRLRPGSIVSARCIDPVLRVLTLRNLSRGGFAIETDIKVLPGLQMSFEFQTVTGLVVHARAVAVHCRIGDARDTRHVSGWRFIDSGSTLSGAKELVDVLLSEGGGPDDAA
jgi:hypothetical protein